MTQINLFIKTEIDPQIANKLTVTRGKRGGIN